MRKIIQTLLLLAVAVLPVLASAQAARTYGTITTQNLVPAGACTAGSCVEIDMTGRGTVTVQVTGTYTGALSGQVTTDGTTWITLAPTPFAPATATGTPTATIASAATGAWQVAAAAGYLKFRVTALAAVTGTAAITLQSSPASAGSSGSAGGDASAANQTTMINSLSVMDDWDEVDRAKVNPIVGQAGVAAGAGAISSATQRVTEADGSSVAGVSCAAACANTNLFTQDMTGYNSVVVHISAVGTGTLTFQTSQDSTNGEDGNWAPTNCSVVNPTVGSSLPSSTPTVTGGWECGKKLKWLRLRITAYTSGTYTTIGAQLTKSPVNFAHVGIGNSTLAIVGQTAHDSPITFAPVRLGGRAMTSNYTAVASGDAADVVTTTVGAVVNKPFSIPEADWSYVAAASGIVNTTTAVTIKAAAAAGIRNYITGCDISTDTLGAATELAIRDGAGGAVLWRAKLQTTALPITSVKFPSPLRGTAATLLEVVTLTAVTGGVYINCNGYQAP